MNLIERLKLISQKASSFSLEHESPAGRQATLDAGREAIETVRAMQEALRKIAEFDQYEPAGPAARIAAEALRRTEGNAG